MKNKLVAFCILFLLAYLPNAIAVGQCGGNNAPGGIAEPCWTSYTTTTTEEPEDVVTVCNFLRVNCNGEFETACAEAGCPDGCLAYLGQCPSKPTDLCPSGETGTWGGTYAACRHSPSLGLYWCGDGNGAPKREVTNYKCHYISEVDTWTTCFNHVQFAATVTWDEVDGKDCSNHPLSQECNSPPTGCAVDVLPNSPDSVDDLTCKLTSASGDPDQPRPLDSIRYTFQWYRNGVLQNSLTSQTGWYLDGHTAAAVETKTISNTHTRSGDTWTCRVTPRDDWGGLNGPYCESSETIRYPNNGCTGTDNDGDGLIDEGMFSCAEGDADGINFYVTPDGTRKYCFDCRKIGGDIRNRAPPTLPGSKYNLYPAALGDGEGKSGVLLVLNRYGTDLTEAADATIADLQRRGGGRGMYVYDDCGALTSSSLGSTDNELYSGGNIGCANSRVYFTAGTSPADPNKGKLTDGTGDGALYGVVYEGTEICDGKDNDGNNVPNSAVGPQAVGIDEDPVYKSCYTSPINSFSVGPSNYCFACGVKAFGAARSTTFPGGWKISDITDANTALDGSGHNTEANLRTIENTAIPLATIYSMKPKGFYVNDTCSKVVTTYVGASNRNLVVGDGSLDCNGEVVLSSWTDREPLTHTGRGKLDDASGTNYGALYEGGSAVTSCGDGIRQFNPPNAAGQAEECDTDNSQCTNPLKPYCNMGALPGLRCVCTGNPPITTDYCGDGIWATSTEACEGNDAHCGAPWFECDMDRIADGDTDDDICVCDRKPYYGEFQPPFTAFTDEIHTFNVVFADNSTLTPVTWVFAKDRTSGDCVNTINFPTRTMTQAYKTNFNLGPLALQARRGSYCAVTLTARAPDSTYAPPGTYSVDTRTLTAICPDCNVTEIPAILHPIGMYSTGLWDAQREYGSASIAVSSLISKCASSCSATAKMRMEQAKTNRAAAQLYYETCVDGDITCRLSQYYSRTAKQYAVEGMNLP